MDSRLNIWSECLITQKGEKAMKTKTKVKAGGIELNHNESSR
jgi:hypothetical protein